jgi:hypothetical protein
VDNYKIREEQHDCDSTLKLVSISKFLDFSILQFASVSCWKQFSFYSDEFFKQF